MASRSKSVSIPFLLVASGIGFALLLAVVMRFESEAPKQTQLVQISVDEQASSTVQEMVVATSGDLLQSIPPSWTFTQIVEDSNNISPLNGLTAVRELHIASVETGTALRLVEYSVTDLVAYKKDVESKSKEKAQIGNISYPVLPSLQGSGIEALIIEGTTKVVILSSDEGKMWQTTGDMALEVGGLLQSMRVQ